MGKQHNEIPNLILAVITPHRNPPSGSLFLNGSWPQQNCPHIQQKLTQETQLVNWKPNQLNFSIKIVFLSPDELTVVK